MPTPQEPIVPSPEQRPTLIELATTVTALIDSAAPLLVTAAFAPAEADGAGPGNGGGGSDGPAPLRRPVLTEGAAGVLAGLGDAVDELVALGFDGAEGSTVRLRATVGGVARTVLVVGLGASSALDAERLRRAAGTAVRAAADATELATDLALVVPPDGTSAEQVAGAVAEGLLLGSYRFERYRTKPKPTRLVRATLTGVDGTALAAVDRARATADAVSWVRDLVNTPPLDKRPAALADLVVEGLEGSGVAVRVLDGEELVAGGYGGIVGVGRGSSVSPRLVELRVTHPQAKRHVAIVGKGITFDTGGYSLKPTSGQETMKTDMAGAATVAAVVRAVARLGLPVDVTGVLAVAENMVSGDAQRVSDVVTMRDGTTVEVMNTDAEGRMVLGDGIAHAAELGPDTIIDVATLTGAIVIALGDLIGGVMANDDELAASIVAAAASVGEPMWQLPLATDEYGKRVEGTVADLRNVGGREAGSIFGALFLHRFVPKGVRWAHLDIAGIAWRDSAGAYLTKGATGSPVRTLITWLETIAAE
jgi:leucyl aminopeptidase